jgi:F420-non-reducing hydrogenase iron-sulfur subunit
VKELLSQVGLEPERAEMFNMSAAQATKFVEAAAQMTERIHELGPNPLRIPRSKNDEKGAEQ